jgi:hypothetical protein
MITNSDLKIHNTSYINKDFYQIYPELLELVNKITDRWDPSASNESDPGVVLLKLLAFIADKINYNIDKNILECFMPSATQEDSMRKLCEMLGYDMKYNQSATTKVSFMWISDELDTKESYRGDNTSYVHLPAFETILTNDSNDINYILTNDVFLNTRYGVYEAEAIEGQLVELEINSDNILQLHNLDSKNRFYLPERNIAQNGIWLIDPETGKK